MRSTCLSDFCTAAPMSRDPRNREKDIATPSERDVSSGDDAIKVLGPMKTITTILRDARQPTVCTILPTKEKITTLMAADDDSDTEFVSSVRQAIVEDTEFRPTLDDNGREEVYASPLRKAKAAHGSPRPDSVDAAEPPVIQPKGAMKDLLREMFSEGHASSDIW